MPIQVWISENEPWLKVLILFFNMLKGELCLEANKDAIFNKGIIEVEKTV